MGVTWALARDEYAQLGAPDRVDGDNVDSRTYNRVGGLAGHAMGLARRRIDIVWPGTVAGIKRRHFVVRNFQSRPDLYINSRTMWPKAGSALEEHAG